MKKDIKIVAISDTHSSIELIYELIEKKVEGDIFIHAGDFTRYGRDRHFLAFFKCLEELKFTHKIVIAGNHEISLDNMMKPERKAKIMEKYSCEVLLNVYSSQEKTSSKN
jgi:predicted phosphodiesterase